MDRKISAIDEIDLMDKGILIINNIEDGFANYEHLILCGTESAYQVFLQRALILNGSSESFVDFYYGRLTDDEKLNFRQSIDKEDLKCLDRIDWAGGVYFPLAEELLLFLSKVTAKELLFSTFYFSKYTCSLWGNYGLRYPIFFKDKGTKEIYWKLALNCGLDVE